MSLYLKDKDGKLFPLTPPYADDIKEIYDVDRQETLFRILVTPSLAGIFLKNQIDNRTLIHSVYEKYRKDIEDGKWEPDAMNPLRFVDGRMYDGQHRCTAIVQSGKSVFCWVCVSEKTIPTNIDTGKSRTYSNIYYMSGKKDSAYSNSGVAIAKFLFSYVGSSKTPSVSAISDFIDQHKEYIHKTMQLSTAGGRKGEIITCKRVGVQAALFCALKFGVPEDIMNDFCMVANTGFMNKDWQTSAIILSKYRDSVEGKSSNFSDRRKLFSIAQEAIVDFVNKYPRKIMYKGEKTFYSESVKNQLFGN